MTNRTAQIHFHILVLKLCHGDARGINGSKGLENSCRNQGKSCPPEKDLFRDDANAGPEYPPRTVATKTRQRYSLDLPYIFSA
jgi:hypothetical protein